MGIPQVRYSKNRLILLFELFRLFGIYRKLESRYHYFGKCCEAQLL